MHSTQRLLKLLPLLLLLVLGTREVRAAPMAKSVTVEDRTSDITILPNGNAQVVETWKVAFHGGPFTHGFREIPFHGLEGISHWHISEDDTAYTPSDLPKPHTYTVEEFSDRVRVTWHFPPTTDAVRTFTLSYTLEQVVWIDEAGDRFRWTAIESNRGYPIAHAVVRIHLPVATETALVEPVAYHDDEETTDRDLRSNDGHTVIFETHDLGEYTAWKVGVRWPHGALTAQPPPWQYEALKQVTVLERSQHAEITTNGNATVMETWHVRFTSGPFSQFTRTIGYAGTDEIAPERLWMDNRLCNDILFCQGETHFGDQGVVAKWYFDPAFDSAHTFQYQYTLKGVVWQGKKTDTFQWAAIEAQHQAPIAQATIIVVLPQTYAEGTWQAEARAGGQILPLAEGNGRRFVWQVQDLSPGVGVAVRLQWPHGAIRAPLPRWQQAQVREARLKVFGAASVVLFLLGGLLAAFLVWYTLGRDPAQGQVVPVMTEPPSDLPPALVGVLVDEKVDQHDLIAAFWGLVQKGYLSLHPPASGEIDKDTPIKRHFLTNEAELTSHEDTLLGAIFASSSEDVTLDDVHQAIHRERSRLERLIYADAVTAGLFRHSPAAVRKWSKRLVGLVWSATVLGLGFLAIALPDPLWAQLCLALGLVAMFLGSVFWWLARFMPRKTRKGAQEAARWLAFKKFLTNIKRYAPAETVAQRFETYYPYAVALGLGRNVAQQFSALPNATLPRWVVPRSARRQQRRATDAVAAAATATQAAESGLSAPQPTAAASLNAAAATVFDSISDLTDHFLASLEGIYTGAVYSGSGGSSSWSSSSGSSSSSWSSSSSSSWSSNSDFSGGGSSGFG